jgi:hypothetical protein
MKFSITTGDSCKGGGEGAEMSLPLVILTEGVRRFRNHQ